MILLTLKHWEAGIFEDWFVFMDPVLRQKCLSVLWKWKDRGWLNLVFAIFLSRCSDNAKQAYF